MMRLTFPVASEVAIEGSDDAAFSALVDEVFSAFASELSQKEKRNTCCMKNEHISMHRNRAKKNKETNRTYILGDFALDDLALLTFVALAVTTERTRSPLSSEMLGVSILCRSGSQAGNED